jgi:hypothetical protein
VRPVPGQRVRIYSSTRSIAPTQRLSERSGPTSPFICPKRALSLRSSDCEQPLWRSCASCRRRRGGFRNTVPTARHRPATPVVLRWSRLSDMIAISRVLKAPTAMVPADAQLPSRDTPRPAPSNDAVGRAAGSTRSSTFAISVFDVRESTLRRSGSAGSQRRDLPERGLSHVPLRPSRNRRSSRRTSFRRPQVGLGRLDRDRVARLAAGRAHRQPMPSTTLRWVRSRRGLVVLGLAAVESWSRVMPC